MRNKNTNPLLHALLPVAAVIIYVLLGYIFKGKGWAAGWIVFLGIPIIESAYNAFRTKNPSAFAYPVFVTALFLTFGMVFRLWHPTWVLFVTIPAFYAICDYINRNRQQRAFEDAEQNPNMPTPPPFAQAQAGETPPYVQYPQYPQNTYYPPKKSNALPIVLSIIFSITAVAIAGIIGVFSFLRGGIGDFVKFGAAFDNDSGYTEINTSAEFKTDDINSIDIDWISGNVNIEYYDGETIFAEESGGSKSHPMQYKIENGILKIDEYRNENWSSFKNMSSKDLTLKMPKTFKADELEISVVSANVYASDLNVNELDFETVSGNGNFEFAVSPVKIDTESVSGDVNLTLPSDVLGYSVSKNTVSGAFRAKDFDNSTHYGDGSVIIKSESVSGSINLSKAADKTITA